MKNINRLFFIETLLLVLSITKGISQDATSYMSPLTPIEKGKAPGMTYKLLSDNKGTKEYVLVFAKNDEVLSGISDFAAQHHILSARFTAIGALRETTMAWFDLNRKSYKLNVIHQQVELTSLIGDIALYNGNPVVHTHFSIGFPDGRVEGGHLIEAVTYPTVELFMTVFPTALQKKLDKETDLKLIHPEIQ
jgi:uncharacterized protein